MNLKKYIEDFEYSLKEGIERLKQEDYKALSDLEQLMLAFDLECVIELFEKTLK